MIRLKDVTVRYGEITALKEVSFEVKQGECVLVTGASGCGKSTLARLLTGLIPQVIPACVEGEVAIDGNEITHMDTPTIAQLVGAVFQNPRAHFFHLRAADEVAFGLRNLGVPEEEVANRVDWALKAVGLSELREKAPYTLSGGQMQRLALASALAMFPKVLVLDEPTASLDVPGTHSFINALEELRSRLGVTIVLIEHRLSEVQRLAQRVIVLDEGHLVADGPLHNVFSDAHFMHRYGLRRPTIEPQKPWVELLVPDGHQKQDEKPLLELVHLSAGYNGHAVIRDINLKIYPGEFVALVGDNGAGKSTLALAASGLIKPLQGRVIFNGRDKPRPGRDIGYLFQNPEDQLFTETVDAEIAFGAHNYGCFDANWHEQILACADMLPLRHRMPSSLSVGQQQRAALASCLSPRPKLLILDEPTLGQDWRHLQTLMQVVLDLNAMGNAILLITHDYKLVHRYAQRVILIHNGQIVLEGNNPATIERTQEYLSGETPHYP